MTARRGVITPLAAPVVGERVQDADRGWGTVMRTTKSGAAWVRFDAVPESEVLFTYRTSLRAWKAFPGPASAEGLRSLA